MTFGKTADSNGCSFYALKEAYRQQLFDALDRKERSKALVWDPDLMKPFFLVANFKDLQDRGVTQMFPLQNSPAPLSPVEHLIYLCQPSLPKMEMIIENVRNVRKDDLRQFHLIFVPRTSVFCQKKLEEAEALDKFATVTELGIFSYVWDSDLLSMQNDNVFRELKIDEDFSSLNDLAMTISQIENLFGPISQCYFKGDWAEKIYNLLKKKRVETVKEDENRISPIEKLVLIDRTVDLVTPLVTQLTYEGLIDEIFGIKCTKCKFPKEKFSSAERDEQASTSAASTGDTKEIVLNSNEELFAELRNLNFNAVGPALSRSIKAIAELEKERHTATTVRECKEFVKRLPRILAAKQSASIHTTIAEIIKEFTSQDDFIDTISCEQEILNSVDVDRIIPYIEDAIAKGQSLHTAIRLICLQSLVSDGLKPKIIDQYRKEFVQSFGYQNLYLLSNLQKCEFLKFHNAAKPSGKSATEIPYSNLRKTFRLMVDNVNEQKPNDLSYVYSGYAPLTARLCHYILKPDWKNILDNLKRIPGGAVGIDENITKLSKQSVNNLLSIKSDDKKFILVVFIGGVTFAEISALRYLSEINENRKFLVFTTNIINGKTVLSTLC